MRPLLTAIDRWFTSLFAMPYRSSDGGNATNPDLGASKVPPGQIAVLLGRTTWMGGLVLIVLLILSILAAPVRSHRFQINDRFVKGVLYALPLTKTLRIDVDFTISSCAALQVVGSDTPAPDDDQYDIAIGLLAELTVTPEVEPDIDSRFWIPTGGFWQRLLGTELDVELGPTGLLKSIGVTTESVAETVRSATARAAGLVTGTLSAPVSTGTTRQTPVEIFCAGLPRPGVNDTPPVVGTIRNLVSPGTSTQIDIRPYEAFSAVDEATLGPLVSQEVYELLDTFVAFRVGMEAPVPAASSAGAATSEPTEFAGIVYRYPELTRVTLCRYEQEAGTCTSTAEESIATATTAVFLAGREAEIAISRGWLRSETMAIQLRDDGGLLRVTQNGEGAAASETVATNNGDTGGTEPPQNS